MTRQEAIDKVYGMSGTKEQHEALEFLIPEVRELREFYERQQEDKRIREELVEFIQWSEDRHFMRHDFHQAKRPSEWIAYLEKQKECVADSSKISADEDESIRKFLVDFFASYKIGDVATKLNGVRIDDILTYLEKQKEQKPADLSEMMVHKEPYIAPVPTPIVADEQKPEWSEEDNEMFKSIVGDLFCGTGYNMELKSAASKKVNWLKVKLKSLRPHWKPSEEQMKALLNAEGLLRKYRHIAIASKLAELYEDLKKL